MVGYGGYDRSIIDVLTFLLKNEDYYKNGIYWCIRESDEIGDELHKLLWKDRVYYVKIDGFDQFFSVLNRNIQPNVLPIDTSIITSKSLTIINSIKDDIHKYNIMTDIIKSDVDSMKQKIEEEQLKFFVKKSFVENEQDEDNKLSIDNHLILIKLNGYIDNGNFKEFKNEVDKISNEKVTNNFFKKSLCLINAEYHESIGNKKEAKRLLENVFDEYTQNPDYLCRALMLVEPDNKNEIERLLKKAFDKDKYYYRPYLINSTFGNGL